MFGALLVYALTTSGLNRLLSNRFMTQTGKYSYALYMVHVPVTREVSELLARSVGSRLGSAPTFLLLVAMAFGLSWLGALLSWNLFEKRLLALKRYFAYR
jgi:peptidoglycan/LPS O-acetylase OafA/YrhL